MSAAEEPVAAPEDAGLEGALVAVFVEVLLGEVEELQAAAVASTRAAGATTRIARVRVRRCIGMLRSERGHCAGREDAVPSRSIGTDVSHERFTRPGGAIGEAAVTW
jgi:hypothetical protein